MVGIGLGLGLHNNLTLPLTLTLTLCPNPNGMGENLPYVERVQRVQRGDWCMVLGVEGAEGVR